MKTLLLNNTDVGKLIDLDDIYKKVEEGYKSFNSGKIVQPPIMHIISPTTGKGFDFKSCLNEDSGFFSNKASSGPYNYVELYDADTTELVCIMEGNYIRNLRTAAGAAIANNYLSRKDAKSYFAFGTGRIGKAALRATMRVRDLKDVYVFGFLEGENDAYIEEMKKDFPNVNFHSCKTVEEGCRNADIIVSVTLAKKGPQIFKKWLKPGTHITEIGVDSPGKQELDASCFDGTKIYNDTVDMCTLYGDTHNAIEAGVITAENIVGEIGEVILGKKPGRENDEEITVYDTVGMGIQDNAMAVALYEKAVEQGMGAEFDFSK